MLHPEQRQRAAHIATAAFLLIALVSGAILLNMRASTPSSDPAKAALSTLAKTFADRVIEQDYAAAYELTSSSLRAKESLAEFEQRHARAREEFGDPIGSKVWIEHCDPNTVVDWYGAVDGMAQVEMRAWICVSLLLEPKTGVNNLTQCFDMYLVIEEENGALRVGLYDFYHCE